MSLCAGRSFCASGSLAAALAVLFPRVCARRVGLSVRDGIVRCDCVNDLDNFDEFVAGKTGRWPVNEAGRKETVSEIVRDDLVETVETVGINMRRFKLRCDSADSRRNEERFILEIDS